MIEYFNEDCMVGMARYPDKHFDLIITSPPYNLGKQHHTGNKRFKPYNKYADDMPEEKYQIWQTNVLNECHRVLKDDGAMFYNHKNRIRNGVQISPYEWILKSNFIVKQEIVWFNGSPNFDKCRFYPMTERIYWLQKTKKGHFRNNINSHDICDWKAEGTNKQHKRSFPLSMVKDILCCFPSGGVVLDPFSGSGTVGIACHDMGFDAVGFELDEDYYKASKQRLKDHMAQMRIEDMSNHISGEDDKPEQITLW